MKKFKILSLVLILVLAASLLPVSALAVSEPEIGAAAAILVDADSGEVYFEKNASQRIEPASTTKIMTVLMAVEAIERGEISLTDNVTASENSSYNLDDDSTGANPRITVGETVSVESLLYCAMLVSANEACNMLGEYLAGTVYGFVDDMNDRAAELGCTGTHFANANGLEDSDHYSTAADFAIIAREAMSHPLFKQICGTYRYTVPETNVTDERELVNTNQLMNSDSEYYFSGAYGVKTGYTSAAGYCLVSAAEKDGIDVICVVMGGPEPEDHFRDTVAILNWMYDNYELRQVLSSARTIVTVPVHTGTSDTVDVRAEDAVSVILPKDYDISRVSYEYVLYHEQEGEKLEAPVNAGEVLGEITVVELDDSKNVVRSFGTSMLVASSTVAMSRIDYIKSELNELFQADMVRKIVTILIILLAAYLLLIAFYFVQRVRHLSSMRRAKKERAARRAEEEAQFLTFPEERDRDPGVEFFPAESEPAALEEPSIPDEEPYEDELPDGVVSFAQAAKKSDAFDDDAAAAEEAPAAEPATEEPKRRVPRNILADDDFFDSFFNT